MMTPPTRSTVPWYWCSDDPSSPAAAPKLAKIVAKPSTKMAVAGTARAGSWASAVSPTMMPRYAGRSGTMQGARNEAIPAPKRATNCTTDRVGQPEKVKA